MMHIAFAADVAYVPHGAAMVHSIIEHAGSQQVAVHLMHAPELAASWIEQLDTLIKGWGGQLHTHAITDDRVAGLPEMSRISRVMWFRVLLPELLPEVERVLYLDCDTLATDSLEALWQTELGDTYLGAVSNVFEKGMEVRAQALGLGTATDYFNSGVLLLNLTAWRKDDCTAKIIAFARDNASSLLWPDQDALNYVLAGNRTALHPRWNCQNSFFYFPQARQVFGSAATDAACRSPGILHFEGPGFAKPWHYLCKHPLRQEYFRHRAATAWPRVAIEQDNWVSRILRLVPRRQLPAALATKIRLQKWLKSWQKLRN